MGSLIDRTIWVNDLFDMYASLLTPHQREVLFLYYSLDFSLGEIAERLDVSRQAVYDSLVRGVEAMENLESSLGFLSQVNAIESCLNDCLAVVAQLRGRADEMSGVQMQESLSTITEELHRLRDALSTAGGEDDGF
ncbi:MAG: sigma factor-like helix-turn-helix DNA-binding protein [Bacillota bacterium]